VTAKPDQIAAAVDELLATAHSLYQRGYSVGTAGNITVRVGETVLATPTGASFGSLRAGEIATTDLDGNVSGPNKPTKELPFHLAAYRARPQSSAVVHLHSTYATAVSCLRELNVHDALPPLTPYYAMNVSCLPVVPYLPPGDPGLADEVARLAVSSPGLLMRNHGSIAIGASVAKAAALAEEIEEAARLFLLLGDRAQPLSAEQVAELRRRFRP
jgi:ribulose-5-phosphate 4-epimerase/fuculose-1-phosphate aldolase